MSLQTVATGDGELEIVVIDSVTRLVPADAGRIVVGGSHGGVYAATRAAAGGALAVILNDASVGKDDAGISGLAHLAGWQLPAATVDHRSARIGDGLDTLRRGVLSHVNAPAVALGVRPGQRVPDAVALMARATPVPRELPHDTTEARALARPAADGAPAVWVMDSVALLTPDDAGIVAITGSHSMLLGGRPETAVKYPVAAAAYNDAGRGDLSGATRLPELDRRGIPAVAVAAASARIGDGASTLRDGVISVVNERAAEYGARVGTALAEWMDELLVRLTGSDERANR